MRGACAVQNSMRQPALSARQAGSLGFSACTASHLRNMASAIGAACSRVVTIERSSSHRKLWKSSTKAGARSRVEKPREDKSYFVHLNRKYTAHKTFTTRSSTTNETGRPAERDIMC